MPPSEQSLLAEINNKISAHMADFRVFKTKMLGDDEEELPTGRIPILEATISKHGRRLARLESFVLLALGAAGAFKAIALVTEFIYHLQGVHKP